MKTPKKILAFILTFAMLCTTGCGMVCDITVSKDGQRTLEDEKLYLTEEEFDQYKLTDEDKKTYNVMQEELNGETYYVLEGTAEDIRQVDSNIKEVSTVADEGGYFTSGKYEMPFATYDLDADDLELHNKIYQSADFLYYNITFPYKVLKANGTISEDGYTVTYNVGKLEKLYPKSGYRLYACFSERAMTATDIKISGAENGKTYSSNRTIKVSSYGAVRYLKVNTKAISGRSITLTKNGTYKVAVKLASGAEKTIRFSIKKYYTLTYKVNGGKAFKVTTKKIRYGSKYGTLKTPTRSGYKFLGWYTKKTGGTKVTSKTVCKKSVTLYAHWKKK